MAAVSIKDLVRKLSNSVMKDPAINKEAIIKNAWVAGRNNREYPEGTIIFEVIDDNSSLQKLYESTHTLVVYPDRIGQLQ